jgi:drug/metabolite transporter (DMT)-like permease
LCLVYAFRYGKAIVVAPMTTALSPVLTVGVSLFIYSIKPHPLIIAGTALAIFAALLMGKAESKTERKKGVQIIDKPVETAVTTGVR